MSAVTFELNGKPVRAEPCANHTTLLEFVRSQGLTGAKEGCAEGECGACTVLLVKAHGTGRSKFVPVNSCLVPLPTVEGQEVFTVEALASEGRLAEVQQAMVDRGGSQCGYCTPGFIVSMFAEQYRPDRVSACDVHNLGGNLCRCTGYRPIRDALAAVGPPDDPRFRLRAGQPTALLGRVETPGFARPVTLRQGLEVLRDQPESIVVAGATDLAVEGNLRGRRFAHFTSVEGLAELRVFEDGQEAVVIGAGLALAEIEGLWQMAPAIVREWFAFFASILIRNRATLGGNLATASPIGDAAPMLLALDASVVIASLAGERVVSLADFFTGYRTTHLARGEVLVAIRVPKPFPTVARFYKVAKRRMDDISTVAVGFSITTDAAGVVTAARLAFGGVAATPVRALVAEQELAGSVWSRAAVERAKRAVAGSLKPITDHRGSGAYRLAMAQSLLDKFWFEGGA